MPKQNRVTPFSELIATPERGTMYGNRGNLHDYKQRIRRRFNGIRWIVCVLEFKGRHHQIMRPGHYTELFFLDEATAFAAGHRPCAECQRDRFNLFRHYWAMANPDAAKSERPLAPAIDSVLHAERLGSRDTWASLSGLPDGTFVTENDSDAYLVLRGGLRRWTPGGYELADASTVKFPVRILTPPSIVKTLRDGYPVDMHASAVQP